MATNQSITCSVNSPNTRKRSPHNGKADKPVSSNIVHFTGAGKSAPALDYRKITPRRLPNATLRSREYLTSDEVDQLSTAARKIGRHTHRDATMILLAFRHGLRVSELVALRWDQVDLKQGTLHVNRAKRGTPSTHPLRGPELRALRRLQRDYTGTPYLFASERGGPVTTSTVRKMITRAGQVADIPFPVHPHMLRHACGYKLANDGHDTRSIQQYLGHKNITHTVRYTELAPGRFNDFWRD